MNTAIKPLIGRARDFLKNLSWENFTAAKASPVPNEEKPAMRI